MPKHRYFLACMPKLENLINHKAKIITEIAWHQRTTVLRRIRCGFQGNSRIISDYWLCSILIPTVFFDTRLWKTKHLRKHFQNLCQSCVLLTDRLKIHQSPLYSMTLRRLEGHTSGCNWWISIWSVNNTQDWWIFNYVLFCHDLYWLQSINCYTSPSMCHNAWSWCI